MSRRASSDPIRLKDGEMRCYICGRTLEEFRQWLDSKINDEKTRNLIWKEKKLAKPVSRFAVLDLTLVRSDDDSLSMNEQIEWKLLSRLGPWDVSVQIHICPICRKIFEARRLFRHTPHPFGEEEYTPSDQIEFEESEE